MKQRLTVVLRTDFYGSFTWASDQWSIPLSGGVDLFHPQPVNVSRSSVAHELKVDTLHFPATSIAAWYIIETKETPDGTDQKAT